MRRITVSQQRAGFLLAECLVVLLIVSVVAIAMAALLWGHNQDDARYAARHNLQKLRSLVREFQRDHGGRVPSDLWDLTQATGLDGSPAGTAETSPSFPFPPYLATLPANPLNQGGGPGCQTVRKTVHHPPRDQDVTPDLGGGWLYNPRTGGVWIDHPDFMDSWDD